jgi:hypothetical protein
MTSVPQSCKQVKAPGRGSAYSFTTGGLVLRVKQIQGSRRGGGLRGSIGPFTQSARRRYMLQLASLDWERILAEEIPFYFITLTTPSEIWGQGARIYKALDKVRRFLKNQPGYQWANVRRELGKKNGMVHYHLLVFGATFVEEDNQVCELSKLWTSALDVHDLPGIIKNGGVASTTIERATDVNVERYLTKYCSKAAYEDKEDAPLGEARKNEDTQPSGAWLSTHNGHRWTYTWGNPLLSPSVSHDYEDGRSVAMHVKRIWRKVIKQRRVKQVLRQLSYSILPQYSSIEERRHEVDRMMEAPARWLLNLAQGFVKKEERKRRRCNWGGLWRSTGCVVILESVLDPDVLLDAAEYASARGRASP